MKAMLALSSGAVNMAERRSRGRSPGKPRIEDVAARAGIATITVSRALRRPDKVAPETRARILAAVEALGYIPNLAASSLASRRSGIIAVVVPTIANSVFADTVQGLSDALTARGFQLLLGQSAYSEAAERDVLAAIIGRQPDGIVLTGVAHAAATRSLLERAGVPVVETWDMTPDPVDILVGFSNEAAGRAMAEHLLAKGRRRLGFVGGADHRAAARRTGWEAAIRDAGLAPAASVTIDEPTSYGAGRRGLDAVLARAPDADAVFFATDVLAVGGLLECRKLGVAVPGRLAVAGFGDLEISAELQPALTTVRIPSYEIGRRAAELLAARIAGETVEAEALDLGFAIVERESA
jgi:LacI family gluconate utilization system Gnt-I transcriptional repressor